MPEIDDNLRDEESLSGFEPGEQGDETFELEKLDKYSGELPDFEFDDEVPVIEAPTDDDLNIVAEIDDESSDEGLDISDTEDEVDYDDSENVDNTEDAEEIQVPKEGGSVWDLFEDDDAKAGEIGDTDESLEPLEEEDDSEIIDLEDDEIDEPELDESEQDEPQNEIEDSDEGVEIDNDLKNLLEKDIALSKKRKAKKESIVKEAPVSKKEFISIDDDEDAQEIDISSIEADRPSTYSQEDDTDDTEEGLEDIKQTKEAIVDLPQEDIPEPPKTDALPEGMELSKHSKKPSAKPDDTGEVKEKKQKKGIPWLALLAISGAILLLAAISITTYYFVFAPNNEVVQKDSLAKIDKQKKDKAKKDKADITEQKVAAKADSADAESMTDTSTAHAEASNIEAIAQQDDIEAREEKEEVDEIVNPTPKKNKKTFKEKVESKPGPVLSKKPKPAPEPKPIPTPEPKPEVKGIYVVQVYSSPYKSDAEEWLERIKNKGVDNAFLSQQKIRDKIWYRVRFGTFSSKEEARSAAKKFGFAQSWIDRIE